MNGPQVVQTPTTNPIKAYKPSDYAESNYQSAMRFYDKTNHPVKEYPEAVIEGFARAAEQGHPQAQYYLRMIVEEEKCPLAQLLLGSMYFRGVPGIEQDRRKAVTFYRDSAAQGYSPAQYCLGYFCKEGLEGIIPQDEQKAKEYFTLAANQGHGHAQWEIGCGGSHPMLN